MATSFDTLLDRVRAASSVADSVTTLMHGLGELAGSAANDPTRGTDWLQQQLGQHADAAAAAVQANLPQPAAPAAAGDRGAPMPIPGTTGASPAPQIVQGNTPPVASSTSAAIVRPMSQPLAPHGEQGQTQPGQPHAGTVSQR